MTNFIRLWHTVKHLKLKQLYHQLLIRIKPTNNISSNIKPKECNSIGLKFIEFINNGQSIVLKENLFSFLNIKHQFNNQIDWNYSDFGKLWTYNLNYFDFLNQEDIEKEKGESLILEYVNDFDKIRDGSEPYPTSLRGVNWIKFISRHQISNLEINRSLCIQYDFLYHNLEYHLLGNHLLENAYSLLFGSYFFQNEKYYTKAKSLIIQELEEQILNDGGHFELSPMYHKILLTRLLDCLNLVINNEWKQDNLKDLLKLKAQLMLGWLKTFSYNDSSTANLNDSVDGIALSSKSIFKYAKMLGLDWSATKLSDSGYRIFKKKNLELLIDVGNIGPDYIPGHAHADTFNFELMVKGKPVIVDTGISTYEKNKTRHLERSTSSHNTVEINNKNQSDVWGGFRVGERAQIVELVEEDNYVMASHNGYKDIGIIHSRSFEINHKQIQVVDIINQKKHSSNICYASLHFHPDVNVRADSQVLYIDSPSIEIQFENSSQVELVDYSYCLGFNKKIKSKKAVIEFSNTLTTILSIN